MHIFDQWDAGDADAQRRRDAHRDLLKALVSARNAGDGKTERALRVLVKASAMEKPVINNRKALLLGLIFMALLGCLAIKVYRDGRTAEALAEFCKEPSELRRMACISSQPTDAPPLPPEG